MNDLFSIFPKIAYKNSQFQIVSKEIGIEIKIYSEKDYLVKTITIDSTTVSLLSIDYDGKLTARCELNGTIYEQKFEVKDAIRLGDSVFKKSFVFDNSDYSFFLMKDRLLLFDEKNQELLTENHYSPSSIYQIDNNNYLFVTNLGDSTNFGIYNTKSFSILAELLHDYQIINILEKSNKVWVLQKSTKSICCFELLGHNENYFSIVKRFDHYEKYFIDGLKQRIVIDFDDKCIIADLINIHKSIEILKQDNNAIDQFGNLVKLENNDLLYVNHFDKIDNSVLFTSELNIQDKNFCHIGCNLLIKSNFDENVESIIPSEAHKDGDSLYYKLKENEQISETIIEHKIMPTKDGIFIIHKKIIKNCEGFKYSRYYERWNPYLSEKVTYKVSFHNSKSYELIIEKSNSLEIEYLYPLLFIKNNDGKYLYLNNEKVNLKDKNLVKFFNIDGISYAIYEKDNYQYIYCEVDFEKPILKKLQILNLKFIEDHYVIWFHEKEKDTLNYYDLLQRRIIESKIFSDVKFYNNYAITSNQVIFNPKTLMIKDSFIGRLESISTNLNKIVSRRNDIVYFSSYNHESNKYISYEIPIKNKNYKESYLSPDGQFLVLQHENDEYAYFDIEKNEPTIFFTGKFLEFNNDGNLVIEDDKSRDIKIIDPLTFEDITPINYRYYKLLSPDGKLYADIGMKKRYESKLTNLKLTSDDIKQYEKDFNDPYTWRMEENEKEILKKELTKNREKIYQEYKSEFNQLGIDDFNKINADTIVKKIKYSEIGIVGTDIKKEIIFPEDLEYYNYAAFSFDNKYFGYVGKPSSKGLIHLFKIEFDEKNNTLDAIGFISRKPKWASWVCGFSRNEYFATYDSAPATYILNLKDDLFDDENMEIKSIYFKILNGKNFLCFSSSGKFMALSEQGYDPVSLGGSGHQVSNAVHVANTISTDIIESFLEHGDKIKKHKTTNLTFAAFSEDESKIMTLSSDGVVIVRNI